MREKGCANTSGRMSARRAAAVEGEYTPHRRHHVAGLEVVEDEHPLDHLALIGLDRALFLAVLGHADQFGLGHHRVALTAGDALHPVRETVEQPDQRKDGAHERHQHRGDDQRDALGVAGGEALGCDLAKDQDHDRQHADGNTRPKMAEPLRGQHGRHGRGRDVDDVVADQDRDQHPRWVDLQAIQRSSAGTPLPVEGFRARQGNGHQRSLGARKDTGEDQ